MAQVIVNSLLFKLAQPVIQEAIILYGVKDKVESMQYYLRWIQLFLKDAVQREDDNRVQIWVKEVQEVSFLIEDAIDIFLYEVESLSLKELGICNTLKRGCKNPMKLVAKHKLDSAINKIQARLKKIKEEKERYNIKNLGDSKIMEVSNRPLVIPEIDKIDLVGLNIDKHKVVHLLLDENISWLSVVSIVGMGGLGKTTLAEKVFQSAEIKQHFDFQVWLTVSKEFEPVDLLKKILEKANNTKFEREYDEEYYTIEVNKLLKEKRYFIVLDDIWSNDVWPQIEVALPNQNNASRVLITTRFFEIAKKANPQSIPYKLLFLNEDESLKLLFEKALPGENFNDQGYPHDLIEIAKKFSKQCGGLPLALVVVGGLLSTKDRTGGAWDRVLNTMDRQTDGNKCTEILASSYEDMPVHLKTCFMYLASFPDDTEYDSEFIIRLWIVEGFIPHDAQDTMEERAQMYLEELSQRCMIRVTKRSSGGSVEYFLVHDLLQDLAIREAREKNFFVVFHEKADRIAVASRAIFRLSYSCWQEVSSEGKKLNYYIHRKVRTLMFFKKVIPFDSGFKLLRILVINGYTSPGDRNPNWCNSLKRLVHLRCLVFKACVFRHLVLPIGLSHSLQTLEIMYCEGIKVPLSLWGIKALRHVVVSDETIIQIGSVWADLPNLQTLIKVTIDEPGIELFNIPNLREVRTSVQ